MMQLTRVVAMQRTSFAKMRCSLARGLDLIGDWWSPLIIRDLFLNVTRFDELVEDLGISRNLLATRLKFLADTELSNDVLISSGRHDMNTASPALGSILCRLF